jgi:flagellar basal-body rod protein FlgB
MTTGIKEGLGVHADALVLRNMRNNLLASNIENAAVPNYKARDIDFASTLAAQTQTGAMRVSNDLHMSTGQSLQNQVGYRVPTMASLDGNTVELSVEQVEFSENTMRYQASLELLNRRISGLMTAIKGE